MSFGGYTYILGYPSNQGIMPSLLVKNVPEDLMRELRRLKAELGCRTWVELLEKLVKMRPREVIVIGEEDVERMRRAIEEFLELREVVTREWGGGSVLEEFRKARRHEGSCLRRR